MNLQDINTQIIFTTVPIWVEDEKGNVSTGTGFFYQKKVDENQTIPFIVTNAHVVANAHKGLIALMKRDGEKPSMNDKVTVELSGSDLNKYVDIENDLAIFPIGPALNQLSTKGVDIFFRSLDPSLIPDEKIISELSAIEEVTFVGYPSGLYDRKNNTPIVRKGITATPIWNDFDGHKRFLIDAGVYPGSSGSPVLIMNNGSFSHQGGITIGSRILFIGIISSTIQRNEESNKVYLGLGQVIKSGVLKKFVDDITNRIK